MFQTLRKKRDTLPLYPSFLLVTVISFVSSPSVVIRYKNVGAQNRVALLSTVYQPTMHISFFAKYTNPLV